jgi:hypothetical protein
VGDNIEPIFKEVRMMTVLPRPSKRMPAQYSKGKVFSSCCLPVQVMRSADKPTSEAKGVTGGNPCFQPKCFSQQAETHPLSIS